MYTKGISKEPEETLKNWYERAVFNRMQLFESLPQQ